MSPSFARLPRITIDGSLDIMIIDDDRSQLKLFEKWLAQTGGDSKARNQALHTVKCFEDENALYEAYEKEGADVVIADYNLGGDVHGLEVLRRVYEIRPVPTVITSATRDFDVLREAARRSYVCGFVSKSPLQQGTIEDIRFILFQAITSAQELYKRTRRSRAESTLSGWLGIDESETHSSVIKTSQRLGVSVDVIVDIVESLAAQGQTVRSRRGEE